MFDAKSLPIVPLWTGTTDPPPQFAGGILEKSAVRGIVIQRECHQLCLFAGWQCQSRTALSTIGDGSVGLL